MTDRKMYNTTIDKALLKELKILAATLEKRQNEVLEEAIRDVLKKYKKKPKK
ncbi:MAG: ribbon-helix-helix domain-containing protein [Thermodesulfobacteriota bacterium]|nr:ribbon-helix-helix domain-containing protein [Thermodesulfobacteriota bacterium]